MKEKIEAMIAIIKSGTYDNEIIHCEYDSLLENFILNYNESLLPLMKELITLEKEFWYA